MILPQAHKRGIGVSFPLLEFPYIVKADRTRVKQGDQSAVECDQIQPRRWELWSSTALPPMKAVSAFALKMRASACRRKNWRSFSAVQPARQESNDEEGTGIGLVVCKRLIELMAVPSALTVWSGRAACSGLN